MWGSMVTGLIRDGGEIMEGSRGGRVPGLDCLRRDALGELAVRDRFRTVGGCFRRREREEQDPVTSS